MHHIIFISDIHLQESEPAKTELFLSFLNNEATKADALYILGDLFEAWLGDDHETPFILKIKNALKVLNTRGTSVYIVRGNRDFLLGSKFAHEAGSTIIDDLALIDLFGRPTLLTHGDMFCTNDKKLMFFRKFAYNPKYNRFFLKLPLKIRHFFARIMRANCKRNNAKKAKAVTNLVPESVAAIMQQATQIIHGHTHTPGVFAIPNIGRRIVIGEWTDKPAFLMYFEDHSVNF